jgi:alkylation response protein AidB-like acyl-CoA dehydrogenase
VPNGWRLKGTKRWITNAGVAGLYVLFAVTDPDAGARGISAFVVEGGDDGLIFGAPERKMGLKGSPTREIVLDDVFIPEDRLVGNEDKDFTWPSGPSTGPAAWSPPRRAAWPRPPWMPP